MNLITINVPAIQGALFADTEGKEMKVYGNTSKIIMTGSLRAQDEKQGDNYVTTVYGQLGIRAAAAKTKDQKDYLHLAIDGGLQGRLMKAEGKDYDYIGNIDAGDGQEITIFGRKRTAAETGKGYIALSSGAKQPRQSNGGGAAAAPAEHGNSHATDNDIPF